MYEACERGMLEGTKRMERALPGSGAVSVLQGTAAGRGLRVPPSDMGELRPCSVCGAMTWILVRVRQAIRRRGYRVLVVCGAPCLACQERQLTEGGKQVQGEVSVDWIAPKRDTGGAG
jgi:hypothetical protein